jgi:hypothetical protein
MTEQLEFNSALNTSLSPKSTLGHGSVVRVMGKSLATNRPTEDDRKQRVGMKQSNFDVLGRIDGNPSESKRRIYQNIISAISTAAILAIAAAIGSNRESIARGSRWLWNVLQSPAPVWLFLLVALTALTLSLLRTTEVKKHQKR